MPGLIGCQRRNQHRTIRAAHSSSQGVLGLFLAISLNSRGRVHFDAESRQNKHSVLQHSFGPLRNHLLYFNTTGGDLHPDANTGLGSENPLERVRQTDLPCIIQGECRVHPLKSASQR